MDNLEQLKQLVRDQAEDEGLWFVAHTAAEAYLQQELRKLHAQIEGLPEALPWPCPTCGSDCNELDELIKAEREIEGLRGLNASQATMIENHMTDISRDRAEIERLTINNRTLRAAIEEALPMAESEWTVDSNYETNGSRAIALMRSALNGGE